MTLIRNIWDKITSRDYWISNLIIVLGILILEVTVSSYILTKFTLNPLLLKGLTLLFIIVILRLTSEEVLEV